MSDVVGGQIAIRLESFQVDERGADEVGKRGGGMSGEERSMRRILVLVLVPP